MEFVQDYMVEGKGQCCVGVLFGVQLVVGQFGQFGIVWVDCYCFGVVVVCFGEEMCIGCMCLWYV